MDATPARPRATLALTCAAQFMVVLDVAVANVALPAIGDDLAVPVRDLHWVVTAYAVAFGGLLLLGGRLADVMGRRRMFSAGTATFTAASLACGLAPTADVLIAGRVAQGIGAALLSPAAFGTLVAVHPAGPARHRAIAAWGSIGSLGAVTGLLVGGVLTELAGREVLFLVNVPFGVAALLVAPVVLPPGVSDTPARLDWVGAMLATAALALGVGALSNAPHVGWRSPAVLAAGAGACALLAAFAAWELRAPQALVPRQLLEDAAFAAAGTVGLVHGGAMLGLLLLLGTYLQLVTGLSAALAGLVLVAVRAPAIAWAQVAGRLAGQVGPRPVLAAGAGLMTSALLVLAELPASGSPLVPLALGLALLGPAIPFLFVSVSATALERVVDEDAGVASGLLSTLQWVGGALGLAAVAAVAASSQDPGAVAEATRSGFHVLALATSAGFLVAIGLLLSARRAAAALPA